MASRTRARTPRRVRSVAVGLAADRSTIKGMSTAQATKAFARAGRELAEFEVAGVPALARSLAHRPCRRNLAPHRFQPAAIARRREAVEALASLALARLVVQRRADTEERVRSALCGIRKRPPCHRVYSPARSFTRRT